MRNPSLWLLFATALLASIGCQSPLRPTSTADLKPPGSLLGEPFDAEAARAKVAARKRAGENSAIAASANGSAVQTAPSTIAQAGFQDTPTQQSAGSTQQTVSHQASSQAPEAVAQHIRQGSEAMSRQDWANATIHYEAILSADPRNPLAHQMLGRIGDQTQRFESAEYHYLRALSDRPQDPNLLSDIGYSYLQQGRFSEAKRFLLKAISIDANHQMAIANLAAVEAYSGDVNAALALLKQISSEQDAHRTLHELLSRPAPAEQRDQQLIGQGTEQLPLVEQMRIARETSRGERTRREALESLEMRERVRQAMAIGGPLNRMSQGLADDELSEIIAQIQADDSDAGEERRQPDSPAQQYAAGPQFGGAAQPGQPGTYAGPPYPGPQQPGAVPQFGQPQQQPQSQQQLRQSYGPNGWPTQATPYAGHESGPNSQQLQFQQRYQQQFQEYAPQSFNGQQYDPSNGQHPPAHLLPTWNGQTPAQNLPSWTGSTPAQPLGPGNGQQQFYNSMPDGNPLNAPPQQWPTPPTQGQFNEGQFNSNEPPVLHNLQQQNERLYQQQFGTPPSDAGNTPPYQSFPNGQQQFAPPNQFQAPPTGSQPEPRYDGRNQYSSGPVRNDEYGNQYAPPAGSGVWNPQGSRPPYEAQGGAIQQLGYQTPANPAGTRPSGSPGQNSMQQAMRLGMAAGPGNLIQMDGRSNTSGPVHSSATGQHNRQQPTSGPETSQQFYPETTLPTADSPSNAVWNSAPNGSRFQSPNQTTWQGGPMPSATPDSTINPQQWPQLPSAQQQPQSSTWNHQHQQSVGPMQSRNWSTAESPGATWQSDSFAPSPTTNSAFARGFMLDPDPSRADTRTANMPGFNQQGNTSPLNSAAPVDSAGSRIPWTAR